MKKVLLLILFLLIPMLVVSVPAINADADSLVLNLTFDDCTANGGAINDNEGDYCIDSPIAGGGKAFEFDGVDDYVYLEGSFVSPIISMCLWVKPNFNYDVPNQQWIVSNANGTTNSFNWGYKAEGSNSDKWAVERGHVYSTLRDATNFGQNEWQHHCAVIRYGTTNNQYYINGIEVSSNYYVRTFRLATELGIGRYEAGDNYYSNCAVDEIKIYNRVLTPSEVQAIYEAEAPLCTGVVPWYAEDLKPNHTDASNIDYSETYGCGCDQILECKPGKNKGEYKHGCSQGTMNVWKNQTGWASQCKD